MAFLTQEQVDSGLFDKYINADPQQVEIEHRAAWDYDPEYRKLFGATPEEQARFAPKTTEQIRKESGIVPERGFLGDVTSNLARGAADLTRLAGYGLKTLDPDGGVDIVERLGQGMVDVADNSQKLDIMKQDESEAAGENLFSRGWKGGVRSAVPSLAPIFTGAAAGAAIGSVVPVIGTAMGGMVGAGLATLGLFGLGTYGEKLHEYKSQGVAEPEAELAAFQQALTEGGIETAASLIGLKIFGVDKFVTQPLKNTVKELLKTPVKTWVKKLAADAFLNEIPTEMLQGALGAEIETGIGLQDEGAWKEAMVESIIPAMTMSLLFGLGSAGMTTVNKRTLKSQLNNMEDPQARLNAVEAIENGIRENEKKGTDGEATRNAEAFANMALDKIDEGLPIDINSDFVEYASQDEAQLDQLRAQGEGAQVIEYGNLVQKRINNLLRLKNPTPRQQENLVNYMAELEEINSQMSQAQAQAEPTVDQDAEFDAEFQRRAEENKNKNQRPYDPRMGGEADLFGAFLDDQQPIKASQRDRQAQIDGVYSEGTPVNEGQDVIDRNIAEFRRLKQQEEEVRRIQAIRYGQTDEVRAQREQEEIEAQREAQRQKFFEREEQRIEGGTALAGWQAPEPIFKNPNAPTKAEIAKRKAFFDAKARELGDVQQEDTVDARQPIEREIPRGLPTPAFGQPRAIGNKQTRSEESTPISPAMAIGNKEQVATPQETGWNGAKAKAEKTIDDKIKSLKDQVEDWKSRKYKSNSTVVKTGVVDEHEESTSRPIGWINEKRRQDTIKALSDEIKDLEQIKAQTSNDSSIPRILAYLENPDANMVDENRIEQIKKQILAEEKEKSVQTQKEIDDAGGFDQYMNDLFGLGKTKPRVSKESFNKAISEQSHNENSPLNKYLFTEDTPENIEYILSGKSKHPRNLVYWQQGRLHHNSPNKSVIVLDVSKIDPSKLQTERDGVGEYLIDAKDIRGAVVGSYKNQYQLRDNFTDLVDNTPAAPDASAPSGVAPAESSQSDVRTQAINDFVETIVAPDLKRAREKGIDVSQEQIDKVKSDQRTRTEEFVDAIEAKDFGPLKDRLHRGNKASLKLFSAITGLSTRTQKETNESIRSLDPVKYDEWIKAKKQKFDKAVADKKAADKEKAYKAMLEAKTNYDSNGKPITFEQHINSLIDNGYTDIEVTEGKFPTTTLIKYENGGKGRTLKSQVFRKKIEQDYVKKMQDQYVEARIAEDIAEEEKDRAENPDKYLSDEETEHLFTRPGAIKSLVEEPDLAQEMTDKMESTNDLIKSKGYTTRGEKGGRKTLIKDGKDVFTGTASQVEQWIKDGEKPVETKAEPQAVETPPTPKEKASKPDGYGKKNKVFTEDAAAKARELLRKKFNTQLNAGLDPEMVQAGITLAGYHIEAGARTFIEYSKAMIADLGAGVKPYLRSFYEGARYFPGMDQKGMTDGQAIDKIDLDKELASTNIEGVQNEDNAGRPGIQDVDTEGDQEVSGGRGGAVAGGRGDRNPTEPRGTLEVSPTEDVPQAETPGDIETDGIRSGVQDAGDSGQVPGRGDAGERRPDGGVEGMVDERPGGTGRSRLGNYHIEDPKLLIGGTPKKRFAKNQQAIEIYNELLDENRDPTSAEKDILAGYIGWGSFGQELFQGTWNNPTERDGWVKENQWLREHLGKEDWESAQRSIINAHYTDPPTVTAVWDILKKMGFKGGRVLEPSAGVGNFFGLMPKDLKQSSDLTGIELDNTTAGIAKMLYPNANIQQMGYQDSKTADNFYDVVVGNWPFAKDGPADRRYNKFRLSLHDYFFVKALDQVRPGGFVVGITSSGTMDKKSKVARLQMDKRADLVAAFRMPSGAFKEYAGTSVVADLIVFQKRKEGTTPNHHGAWGESVPMLDNNGRPVKATDGKAIFVNEYWAEHPNNVLGEMTVGHGTTQGREGMIVNRKNNYGDVLSSIAERIPEKIMTPRTDVDHVRYISNNTTERQNSVTITKDGLYVVRGERLANLNDVVKYEVKDEEKTADRTEQIKSLVGIRDAYGKLLDSERLGHDGVEDLRKELKTLYDAFVKKHGSINESYGIKIFNKINDPLAPALIALEINVGTKKKPKFEPSKIFTESTQRTKPAMENPTIAEAFVLDRNENALYVDLESIAEKANSTVEKVKAELTKNNAIFETPSGLFEVADVYLSGNVKQKLREAKAAQASGKDLSNNIKELEKVIPEDTPYFQIEVGVGATWVPQEVYQDFIGDIGNLPQDVKDTIRLTPSINGWIVKFDNPSLLNNRPDVKTMWVTEGSSFTRVVSAAFTGSTIKIMSRDSDGNSYLDTEKSLRANEKVDEIRTRFKDWIWADVDRRVAMEEQFNEVVNAFATPDYDGSFLNFDGMALQIGENEFNLRQHQVNGIWRGIVNGRGLYAHEVGTGKTFTMAGIAVESRRYGLAKKPLILAHNANSESVAKDINVMYPGANVLYIDNLSPQTIDSKLYQIANDDWDAIVMPHSIMDRLTLSEETLNRISAEEIAALEADAIESAAEEGFDIEGILDDEVALRKIRGATTAKELVKQRNRIIETIQKQAQRSSRENAITFESLGIDMIIVDEAHIFKKPPLSTRMRVKGLNTEATASSIGLHFLTSYIKEINNGKGVFTFTGTPITNTLNEVFNQMRYVMSDKMEDAGIDTWDAWFNTFADVESDIEITAAGDYQTVTRLTEFNNVPELRRFSGQYMDIVFADDMPEFKPRPTDSGKTMKDKDLTKTEKDELLNGRVDDGEPIGRPYKKIQNEVADMSPDQEEILRDVMERALSFRQADGQERYNIMRSGDRRNPVVVEGDAAKAGFDARLYDRMLPDHPNNKINRSVKNIMEHYLEHEKSAQVVFMEKGFNDTVKRTKTRDGIKTSTTHQVFNAAKELIDKLVEAGIPREQIAIVDGKTTKKKRQEIADAVNKAEIRVVIGQTSTLGTGVNMQENLRAMHHLDAPWMPGELEQRNGRGHRQGNRWNTVMEYRYITNRIDGKRWQVLAKKQRMIQNFLKAKEGVRTVSGDALDMNESNELEDITSSFSEAAGDARILIRAKLEKDVEKLLRRERTHDRGIVDAKTNAEKLTRQMPKAEQTAKDTREDSNHYLSQKDNPFSITLEGKTYDKKEDSNAAFEKMAIKLSRIPQLNVEEKVGSYLGFEIIAEINAAGQKGVNFVLERKTNVYVKPSINSLNAHLRNLASRSDKFDQEIVDVKSSIEKLKSVSKEKFGQADLLKRKKDQLTQVEADLQAFPDPPPPWLAQGAPIDTDVYIDGKAASVDGHRAGEHDYYLLVTKEDGTPDVISYKEATDENGIQIYEIAEAPQVIAEQAPVKADSPIAEEYGTIGRGRVHTDSRMTQFSTTSVKPWAEDFPNVIVHTSAGKVAPNKDGKGGHPDHADAKAGDTHAANRLVGDLINIQKIESLAKQFPSAIVVPVHAEEQSGRNKIPQAMARAYNEIGGFGVDLSIVQTNKTSHSGKNALQRITSRAIFDGNVVEGQEYIILDDIVTTGETLSELRHFIENQGGKVVAASTLGYARNSTVLAIRPKTLKELKEKFNESELRKAIREFNIAGEIHALTNSEGKYILKYSDVDSFRNRIIEERQNRSGQNLYSVFQEEVRASEEQEVTPTSTDKPAVTLSQIKKWFKGQSVGVNTDGSTWVRLKNGAGLTVRNVKQVAEGKYLISTESGKMDQNGVIAGKYLNNEIELVDGVATSKTLSHEVEHWLEDIGLITTMDKSVLDAAINAMSKKGNFNKLQDQRENRANFLAQYLADRKQFRGGLMGQLLQKIADFLDGLLNLGRSSVRKIARGIESGETFSRDAKGGKGGVSYQTVYHGTPHEWQPEPGFPNGRPRLDKMGSGEGNQAFGWGWYSADVQDIAKSYLQDPTRHIGNYGKEETVKRLNRIIKEGRTKKVREMAQYELDVIEKRKIPEQSLYTLDIPDATIPTLLDWDKPLSQQSDYVKKALSRAKNLPIQGGGKTLGDALNKDLKGLGIYDRIIGAATYDSVHNGGKFKQGMSREQAASEYLASIGIPGNKYLDGNSRTEGEGTHNYVIWDQAVLDKVALLERNGDKIEAIQGEAQTDPRIQYSTVQTEEPFNVEDNSGIVDDFKYNIVDMLSPISKIYKSIGKEIPENIDFLLKERLRVSKAKAEIDEAEVKYFNPIKKIIGESGLTVEDVDEYLYARHAPEANARLRMTNARYYLLKLAEAQKGGKLRKAIDEMDAAFDMMESPTYEVQAAYQDLLESEVLNATTDEEMAVADTWENFKAKPSGMTDQEAGNLTAKWSRNKALQKIATIFDEMNNESLDISLAAGRMTQTEHAAIKGTFEYYAPLHREGFEKKRAFSGIGQGISNLGTDVKTRGGSTKRAVHLLANAMVNHEKTIMNAKKAEVARTFLDFVKKNPNKDFWWFEKSKTQATYDSQGNIRRVPSQNIEDNEVKIKVDGKIHIVSVNKDNIHAMRMLDVIKGNLHRSGPIVNAMSRFNRILAAVNTTMNPEFVISNFARDAQTAAVNLSDTEVAGMRKEVFKNIPKAMAGLRSLSRGDGSHEWAKIAKQYKASGAQIGWIDYGKDVVSRAKKLESQVDLFRDGHIPKKTITNLFKFIEDYNSIVENAVRMSTFKAGIDSGMTEAKAAMMAKGLTVNFNQKGAMGPVINSLYLFANAGIQGSAKIVSVLRNSPRARKMVGGSVLAATALAIANSEMGGDDDDDIPYYDKIDDHIKARNLIFMLPGTKGDFVKIPLPWGYNVFWALGTEIGDAFTKKNYKPLDGASRMISTTLDAFNPLQSATLLQTLSPTALDPVAMVGENKTFFGGPLMPEQNLFDKTPTPDSERYWKSARGVSKGVAHLLNSVTGGDKVEPGLIDVSPQTLDLVFDTFTGGAGKFVSDTLALPISSATGNLTISRTPMLRKVMGTKSEYKTASEYRENTTHVYRLREKVKIYPDKAREYMKDPTYKLLPWAKKTDRDVSRLNKILKQTTNKATKEKIEKRIERLKQSFNSRFISLQS